MPRNNLRILYNNISDLSTTSLTASVSSTGTSNLKVDSKSKVWKSGTSSTTAVKANIVATFSSKIVNAIILPFSNLSTTATIRVRGYTGTAPTLGGTIDTPTITTSGTLIFDTGTKNACPYQKFSQWNYENTPLGVNTYAYGGGTYARCYVADAEFVALTPTACTSLVIEIIDTNTDQYAEASRLLLGQYWSPTYNTSFGISAGQKDLGKHIRLECGDLETLRGPRYNTLSFDLKYMNDTDRNKFWEIAKGNGLSRPLFVSIFPEDDDYEKESIHQIYGKLSQLSAIQHPMFTIYSTQVELEEV
jgi:hypothetical protein